MSGDNNGTGSGNAVAEVISAAQSLAESVGPEWGLAILLVILLFLPKYGVVVHLAELFKEDRADARKRQVEHKRLESRLLGRARSAKPSAPKRIEQKGDKK